MSQRETIECTIDQLSELSVETWRLSQWVSNLSSQKSSIARHVLRKYERFFQGIGLEILDMTGKTYDHGMALDIIETINDESLEPGIEVVKETISPIVVYQGQVVKHGQVVTRKKSEILEQRSKNNESVY